MIDPETTLLPLVDEDGQIVGAATRGECHNGSRLLHPVVHLHLINRDGAVYLQKRPTWKSIQPGKWDTACGGHVDLGENVEQALRREVAEELGITEGYTPERIHAYLFDSKREREMVYVHVAQGYDGPVCPDRDELDGGRFWSRDEIAAAMGKDLLTPNFEQEYRDVLLPWLLRREAATEAGTQATENQTTQL